MSWREKIHKTKAALVEHDELSIVFSCSDHGMPAELLESLRRHFPFVDPEYLDFLSLSDGIQIDMFVLFGSGESAFSPIESALKRWSHIINEARAMPIGEDPSGSCIAMNYKR